MQLITRQCKLNTARTASLALPNQPSAQQEVVVVWEMAQTASSPPVVFHKPASRNLAMLRVAQMLALRNGQYPAQSTHFRILEN